MTSPVRPCTRGARHWFAYPGWVGSSAPTCTRYGCDVPNPNYSPDADPKRVEEDMPGSPAWPLSEEPTP